MVAERVGMRQQVEELLRNYSLPGRAPVKVELDTSLDRIHFYIQYHGLNDRHLQELIAKAYLVHMDYNINYYNPLLLNSPGETDQKKENCKARVGFLSKFFGVFEPHGLLLDGVMKYLPRSHFEVIALSVARTDGNALPLLFMIYAHENCNMFYLSIFYSRKNLIPGNLGVGGHCTGSFARYHPRIGSHQQIEPRHFNFRGCS
jgi:hypothetical protein